MKPRRLERVELDTIDLTLLKLLSDDARLSQRALARAIGMSPAAVAERVARLEHAGVIKGYHARIDLEALDRTMTVYVAISSSAASFDHFAIAQRLLQFPEVESVDLVMGPMDLMVKLRIRDAAHLREFYLETFLSVEGIANTQSYLVLAGLERDNYASDLLGSISEEQR